MTKLPSSAGPDMQNASSEVTSTMSYTFALTALVIGSIAMGASPIFVRLADVGPFASAFWRVLLAIPALWVWAHYETRGVAHERPSTLSGPDRRLIALAGFFFAGDLIFWHLSIVKTTVANATFFATMTPVIVLLASAVLFKDRIHRRLIVGLALCLAGGSMLVGVSLTLAPERLLGDLYGLVTAFFFASTILCISRLRGRGIGPGRITYLSAIVTAAILFPVALIAEPTLIPHSLAGMTAILALALVSHVGGQGLLSMALGTLAAGFSSLVIFLEGVAAAALGWLVLNEALTPMQIAGALVILAGVAVAGHRPGPQR